MKGSRRIVLTASGIVIVLVFGGFVILRFFALSSASNQKARPGLTVRVDMVKSQYLTISLKYNADILSVQAADIYARVTGVLVNENVNIGSPVREGQLLGVIDSTEYYQMYQQTQATYQNDDLTYSRSKELSEQNLIAKQDLDNAQAAMKVAKANFETAATHLSYCKVTAPFSGVITKRFLDPGANVTSTNVDLFTLMDLDKMKVTVYVLEKDLPLVSIGKKAVVTVDAYPNKEFTGAVTRMADALDLSTRTMEVEIDIPNPDHLLKPGMYANVSVVIDEHPNVVTVPDNVIQKDDQGTYVFTYVGGKSKKIPITLGIEQNFQTEITSGLKADDTIITVGASLCRDGGAVAVVK